MKMKLNYWLMALFGLALFACESTESDIVNPVASGDNGIAAAIDNGSSQVCAEPYTFPLQFDPFEDRPAGDVTVSNDDMYLYVTVASDAGFDANLDPNILVWVGVNQADIPVNEWNFPDLNPDNYDYKIYAGDMEYTFTIPLADIEGYNNECGVQELYLFIAAYVDYEIDGGGIVKLTAYGGNQFVDGSAPWWYDMYTPQCCEDEGEIGCQTAYAKFPADMGYVFTDKNNANPDGHPSLGIGNNWGWAGLFTEDGKYEYNIYAGAGRNDINKGTLVGTLTVEVDGDEVTVTYDLSGSNTMEVIHIYVSNDEPTTTAPGQYGWTVEDMGELTSYSHTFTVDGDEDIWVIAHAEVCGPGLSDDEEEVE